MNEVLENYEEVKSILLENLNEIINDDDIKKLEKILEDITKQQNKMMELYKKKVKCEITQDEYDKRAVVIQTQIDILNEKRAKLEENKSTKMLAKNRIEEIGKLVNDHIDEFDDELFTKLIDQIIVRNRYDLEFQFQCGITKTIRASEE